MYIYTTSHYVPLTFGITKDLLPIQATYTHEHCTLATVYYDVTILDCITVSKSVVDGAISYIMSLVWHRQNDSLA